MDPGTLIQQQPLSLHSDYPLSADHDCIDQFSHHQSTYAGAGVVDQMRRDGIITQQASGTSGYSFTPTNHPQATRYVPDRNGASDTNGYTVTQQFIDSSSGSTGTSPSSAVSSLTYTNYPPNHYTGGPAFAGAVQQQQLSPGFLQTCTATRVPSILDTSMPTMLPPPQRSPISTFIHPGDRDAYVTSTSIISRNQQPSNIQTGYGHGSYPETPRSVLSSTAALSLSSGSTAYSHMASPGYGSQASESANFSWPHLEVLLEMTCEGQSVTPEIHAKVEKGFFLSTVDNKWTCYRRNYFSVQCNFELHPNIHNGRMYLKRNNAPQAIQAMGMRLSAAVDGSAGKGIELIQHTPKRDNGPKTKIDVNKVSPTPPANRQEQHSMSPHGMYQIPSHIFHPTGTVPGPYLPLQNIPSDSSPPMSSTLQVSQQLPPNLSYATGAHLPLPGQTTMHSFERVQFKQATANNGKRRASQQYFHLIVELFADVRQDNDDQPTWVKVAQRVSEKIVVRGRSPSHYQNEGQHGAAVGGAGGGRGGSTGSGGVYTAPSGSQATYGSMNPGAFRSSAGGGYNGLSNGTGSGMYRNHGYDRQASPENYSGSSPDSIEHGAVVVDHPMDSNGMTEAERTNFQEFPGYQYHPGPLREAGLVPYNSNHQNGQIVPRNQPMPYLPSLAKLESNSRFSTEPGNYVAKTEYPTTSSETSINGIGIRPLSVDMFGTSRFQGYDTSRGYFAPDVGASTY